MRDGDRFWWAILIVGLVLCASGVLAPYFILNQLPVGNPFFTRADTWQTLGMAASIALICGGAGVGIALWAAPVRKRHLLRVAAFRGDEKAMPPADMRADASRAPDVAQQPVELMWRIALVRKSISGVLESTRVAIMLLQLGLGAVTVALTVFALVAPIFMPPQPSADPFAPAPQAMGTTETVLRLVGACAIIALVIGVMPLLWRVMRTLFGRPFGIVANTSGVEEHTWLGTCRRIAWNEMRLLEVTSSTGQAKRAFHIYAPGKRIDWTEFRVDLSLSSSEYVPVGATPAEMMLRQEALLNLIAARTRLMPRTLARGLQVKQGTRPGGNRWTGAAALVMAAIPCAALAGLEYVFPVTDYVWMNWASEGSLVLVTCLLLVASVGVLIRRRPPQLAAAPVVPAPPLSSPGLAYTLAWRLPAAPRLFASALGAILLINLIPPVTSLVQSFGTIIAPFVGGPVVVDAGSPGAIRSVLLAICLAIVGTLGVGMFYAATLLAGSRIRADASGITICSGRRTTFVVWSSLREITLDHSRQGQATYEVRTDTRSILVAWPGDVQLAGAMQPSDGAIPIGPDELAALVAAKIGQPIRVREG